MSEQQTHTFPPGAIKEFLTPILPKHEQYILEQLSQSKTIYDILFTEQAETPPPAVLKAKLIAAGLILIGPPIEQSFDLTPGTTQLFRAPDRSVTSGDVIVPSGQHLTVPDFNTEPSFTELKLSLLINNANHNRVLLVEKLYSFPGVPFAGATIDLANADVVTDVGPGLDFVPADGSVHASSNGTYSITLLAQVL